MIVFLILLVAAGYSGLGFVGGKCVGGALLLPLDLHARAQGAFLPSIYPELECPSANRASTLSLQFLAFRLAVIVTGPLVGSLADRLGSREAFHILLYPFLPKRVISCKIQAIRIFK
jgi:hypothetical protein